MNCIYISVLYVHALAKLAPALVVPACTPETANAIPLVQFLRKFKANLNQTFANKREF